MKILIFTVLSSLLLLCIEGATLPPSFKICKRSEPDLNACFKEAVQVALPLLKDGISDLGIPPAEPLYVNSMTLGGGSGAMKVQQNYKNVKIYDIINAKVDDATLKVGDKTFDATVSITIPKCRAEADYDLDGQILMLPITGNGKCTLEFENAKALIIMKGELFDKKGKTHVKLGELKVDLKPENAKFHFDNLFDGDKQLSDQMNKLINDSWKDLYEEVKDGYNDMLAGLVKNVADTVFNKVPYDELLP
ncbi:hypothetical protein ILUMI_05370 [Ignelater luminosus]|uniref:Uncharacterized protein n=1 Tax=Ignelater luminosus TaxID=2038154 RepID=A0A8K0DCH3_IGNLU|nr:hypothetical protein ILUMI_05370 [Ignelater luminosus]